MIWEDLLKPIIIGLAVTLLLALGFVSLIIWLSSGGSQPKGSQMENLSVIRTYPNQIYIFEVDEHEYIAHYSGGIIHKVDCKKCQNNTTEK